MKKIFFFLSIITTIFFSCKKSSPIQVNNNNGGNNNGGNNGNGNNSSMTITSISPASPYPDDEITINGTGFNTDKTKDTVEFGKLMGSALAAWHDGLPEEWASLTTIVSASATQLVIKAVNPQPLDYNSFDLSPTSIAALSVRTGGKKVVSSLIPFKRLMQLGYIRDADADITGIGRPNDSLEIFGTGFRKSGLAVSVGGTQLTGFNIDSASNGSNISQVKLRLPKAFFGIDNDETKTITKTVTITNPDGKTVHKDFDFFVSPRMYINDIHPESKEYSLSALTASAGVVKIIVKGACLKDDAYITLGVTGYSTKFPLPATNLQDSVVFEIGTSSLPHQGTYTVRIWRGDNVLYAGCNFNLKP
jgi:hypothetical protein